jgi:hypothetical protein
MSIGSSFVNFRPSPSMMLHFKAHFPHPMHLRPNTYNNYFEANLTNIGFGNGGHYYATIINSSHSHWALA